MPTERWIRVAGPGEFRGMGTWRKVDPNDAEAVAYWTECKVTGFLPIIEVFDLAVDDLVKDKDGKVPAYIVQDEWIVNQKMGVRTLMGPPDPRSMQFAQNQIVHFLQQTSLEGEATSTEVANAGHVE